MSFKHIATSLVVLGVILIQRCNANCLPSYAAPAFTSPYAYKPTYAYPPAPAYPEAPAYPSSICGCQSNPAAQAYGYQTSPQVAYSYEASPLALAPASYGYQSSPVTLPATCGYQSQAYAYPTAPVSPPSCGCHNVPAPPCGCPYY